MNNMLQPSYLKSLTSSLGLYKTKEKTDMILEPLQSMIQIALLKVLPIGTKLAIHENTLELQAPSLTQPLSRWRNSDRKDDLYFLFQVIKRFIKWYGPDSSIRPLPVELFNLIIMMAQKGLNNLLQTYQTSDAIALIQVIQMYQDMLINLRVKHDKEVDSESDKEKHNLDEIFENIVNIYNIQLLSIIHNSLILINEEVVDETINNYITGLNLMMIKVNQNIKLWIRNNLTV